MTEEYSSSTKDLLFTFLSKAGRGKDEMIEILGKEIGGAFAAMIKKPLGELAKGHKLQITIEIVPKSTKPGKKSRN